MTNHPALALACLLAAAPACAKHEISVTLDGNYYLQAGSVSSDFDMAAFTYGLGAGGAVFQSFNAGGTEEAPLNDGMNRYKRHSWYFDEPTKMFTFSGLDIDREGVTDEHLDYSGSSLLGAYVEITFVDGYYKRIPLNLTGWDVSQTLPVPDVPSGILALAGLSFILARARSLKNV